jgi:hypothetical protein
MVNPTTSDDELCNKILEYSHGDDPHKIKAVELIFDNFYKLSKECKRLLIDLCKHQQSLSLRLHIANRLEKPHNIDTHISADVIETLSYDKSTDIQSVISRLKNTNEDFRKYLEEWGRCPECKAQGLVPTSAVYPNYDSTSDSYYGLRCSNNHVWNNLPLLRMRPLWSYLEDSYVKQAKLVKELTVLSNELVKSSIPHVDTKVKELKDKIGQLSSEMNTLEIYKKELERLQNYIKNL